MTKETVLTNLVKFKRQLRVFYARQLSAAIADMLEWLVIIILSLSAIPSMLGLLTGLTDKAPSADLILFIFIAQLVMFLRSAIRRDLLNLITCGFGFFIQAVILSLIVFK